MYTSATKRLSPSYAPRIASPYQIPRALEHGSESNPNHRPQNHSTGACKLLYSPRYDAVGRCFAPFTFETDVEPRQPNSFAFKVWYKTHGDFGLEKEGLARWLHNIHHMDPLGAPVNFNLTSKLGFADPEMCLLESICGWARGRSLRDDDREACQDRIQ
jgi:hypothetical protein